MRHTKDTWEKMSAHYEWLATQAKEIGDMARYATFKIKSQICLENMAMGA